MLNFKLIKTVAILFGVIASSSTYAEVKSQYKLVSAGKSSTPNFITKVYSVNGPIKVKYNYGLDGMGKYQYALMLNIIDNNKGVIPADLKNASLDGGGNGNKTVKSLKITKPPKDGCSFNGVATITVGKILLDLPEYPTSSESTVSNINVISSTSPKLVCE